MVRKSVKVGFKVRKKLTAGERKCSKMVGRVEIVTAVEQCASGAKDLRFIGREFHK